MSLTRPQKALLWSGLIAGAIAIGKGIKDAVQDFSRNFKFFISGFGIQGFPKDPSGKILWNQLRTITRVGLYNQSMVSLTIKDIWISIEYYDKTAKAWYPFAASFKVKESLSIPAKQTSYDQFILDVNLSELLFSEFWRVISEPIDFKIISVFSVYGSRQRAEQIYKITLPATLIGYLKTIFASKSTGTKGIGYTAAKKRTLKPGNEYTALIEGAETKNRRVVVNANASVEETVAHLDKIAAETAYQTKKLANVLYDSDLKKFGKNIWEFLYNHIQYQLDKDGEEELREPARAWKDRVRGVDCDCYSLFISTILRNKGIPHFFRVVKMYGRDSYQHIYVVVPYNPASFKYDDLNTYVPIDPVMEYFGSDPEKVTGVLDVKAKI